MGWFIHKIKKIQKFLLLKKGRVGKGKKNCSEIEIYNIESKLPRIGKGKKNPKLEELEKKGQIIWYDL